MVVVEDRGPRHLVLLDPRLDEALTTARLPADRAFVLAALLTGARFTLTPADQPAGLEPYTMTAFHYPTAGLTAPGTVSVCSCCAGRSPCWARAWNCT
jgi:hypothetical protein